MLWIVEPKKIQKSYDENVYRHARKNGTEQIMNWKMGYEWNFEDTAR